MSAQTHPQGSRSGPHDLRADIGAVLRGGCGLILGSLDALQGSCLLLKHMQSSGGLLLHLLELPELLVMWLLQGRRSHEAVLVQHIARLCAWAGSHIQLMVAAAGQGVLALMYPCWQAVRRQLHGSTSKSQCLDKAACQAPSA